MSACEDGSLRPILGALVPGILALVWVFACGAARAAHAPTALSAPSSATTPLDPDYSSADDFFRAQRLHTVELTISAADFARMPPPNGGAGRGVGGWQVNGGLQGNGDDDTAASGYTKVPAELRFDGEDYGQIAIRYKGNSSYRGAHSELKRSLKLEFAHGDEHQRFFGMREINLNNNAFDGSQMRETLAYDVFRQADVPAPRTAYARVYITVPGTYQHDYAGLFTVVEQVDQAFFKDRWGRKVGVLVKPEGLSGLPDLGKDWKAYARAYTSKLSARDEDAQRLMDFVQFVDHASDDDFVAHIGDYLDVDEFLRFLAVEAVIVNSDSPLAMNHNYYLTVHPDTHRVVWVPWDMNMAFGGFRRGELDLSVLRPSALGTFPLADRILASSALLERYRQAIESIMRDDMSRARMQSEMRRLLTRIHAAALQDPAGEPAQFDQNFVEHPAGRAPGLGTASPGHRAGSGTAPAFDTGFARRLSRRIDDFDDGNFGGFGIHDRQGPSLRAFIEQRIDSVRGQLDGTRRGVTGQAGFSVGQ